MASEKFITFTTKGRVVIPIGLRRQHEIKAGTQATVIATSEGILLKPINRDRICGLQGKYAGVGPSTADLEAERREDRIREAH